MRYLTLIAVAVMSLAGCTWETYQKPDGHTALRQKYEKGTRVYYEDGTYSHNMRNNQYRPEQHAVKPSMSTEENVRGTNWQKPSNKQSADQQSDQQ